MERKETAKEREHRKYAYVSYVLSKAKGMVDETQLIKEAEAKFEEENPHEN